MSRKEDLLKIFENVENKEIVIKLIDEVVFLEQQLEQLKNLPMIKVHPTIKELSKPTPAAKLYKEMTQQYVNVVKALQSTIKVGDSEEESPLEIYLRSLNEN